MNTTKFRYKNIFVFSSFQFIGNIEEYFVQHTEKLIVHIVMPRTRNKYNIAKFYRKGKLVEEKKLWSTENIFLYYLSWYIQHIYLAFHYFSPKEKVFVFAYNPLAFFGISIQRIFRNISPVFFIGDYCPARTTPIRMFEWTKKHYHDVLPYACYLSDTINKIMNNGKIINMENRKTVMWGVKPKKIFRKLPDASLSLLFVGLIKDSQGLEFFFEFLKTNKNYSINVLGVCEDKLYNTYKKVIANYNINKQVYFPNRFFKDEEVVKIAKNCHVGVALYDIGKQNMTYYTEPGKVKYYAELGLPIIMSDVSSIVPYVKKYHAGEIVERNEKSIRDALLKIKSNYNSYVNGLKEFNNFFYYDTYYQDKFVFMEEK